MPDFRLFFMPDFRLHFLPDFRLFFMPDFRLHFCLTLGFTFWRNLSFSLCQTLGFSLCRTLGFTLCRTFRLLFILDFRLFIFFMPGNRNRGRRNKKKNCAMKQRRKKQPSQDWVLKKLSPVSLLSFTKFQVPVTLGWKLGCLYFQWLLVLLRWLKRIFNSSLECLIDVLSNIKW